MNETGDRNDGPTGGLPRPAVWWLAGILSLTTTAEAHLVQTGFGTFYDGIAHLFITPSDLLLVIGLALLGGLRGRATSRGVLVVVPPAWLAAGVIGMGWPDAMPPDWAMGLTVGLVGALVLSDARVPRGPVILGSGLIALFHGFVNGATMAPGGADWLALVGASFAVFVIISLLSAAVAGLTSGWPRVVVRVAGSWMVAITILMIGWAFHS